MCEESPPISMALSTCTRYSRAFVLSSSRTKSYSFKMLSIFSPEILFSFTAADNAFESWDCPLEVQPPTAMVMTRKRIVDRDIVMNQKRKNRQKYWRLL